MVQAARPSSASGGDVDVAPLLPQSAPPPSTGWPAAAIPWAGCLVSLATILTCYALTQAFGHTSFTTPPISLLGNHPPEMYIYSYGFGVAGVLFSASACIQLAFLRRRIESVLGTYEGNARLANCVATASGIASGVFLALHGCIPMQENADQILSGQDLPITPASIVHQTMAGFFFLSGLLHCCATTTVYYYLRASPACAASYRLKRTVALVALLVFFLGPIVYPAVVGKVESERSRRHNDWGALLQYAVVAALLAFTATSAADLRGTALYLRVPTEAGGAPR